MMTRKRKLVDEFVAGKFSLFRTFFNNSHTYFERFLNTDSFDPDISLSEVTNAQEENSESG